MLALFIAALSAAATQELQARAELEPAVVAVGRPAVLRVTVESRGRGSPEIAQPTLPIGLGMVGTHESTSTSMSVPGGRTTILVREFVLLAQREGVYAIPRIRVDGGGETRWTAPLTLRVQQEMQDAEPRGARLQVAMVPDSVYVGQQSTLIAELLLTPDLQMRLARPPTYELPAPSEFWVQELPLEPQAETVTRGTERFDLQRFGRAYFPLTPGRYAFAPVRVAYEAREGFIFAPRTVELRSESPTLTVLPLPSAGRPAGFAGAVGAFTVSTVLDARAAAVGDAVTLTLAIEGTGNIKALPPPVLPPIQHVAVLDPTEAAQALPRGRLVQGSKRFTWLLVPERVGRVEIPPITYSFFDPDAEKYVTVSSSALTFEVAPAGAIDSREDARRTVRPRPARGPLDFTRSRAFAVLQLAPGLAVLAALVLRRRRAAPPRALKREWQRRAASLEQRADFAAQAERLLRDVLFEISGNPRFRSGAASELSAEFAAVLPSRDAEDAAALLRQLAEARYSSAEIRPELRRELTQRLQRLLAAVWQSFRQTSRAAVAPLILALAMAQTPNPLFQEGVRAYAGGDAPRAVSAFTRYVAARADDRNGWYNLGRAHQAARQPAASAWALLHAYRLEPRSTALSAELARAGVGRLADRVRPASTLTTSESVLLICVLWWVACALLVSAILTRRKRVGWVAALPLAAAGVLAILSAAERALPPAGIVLDNGANLYVGRSLHAETLRQLQPLAGVSILEQQGPWVRVRTEDGETGWSRADLIGRL